MTHNQRTHYVHSRDEQLNMLTRQTLSFSNLVEYKHFCLDASLLYHHP